MFCPKCGKQIPDGSKFCPYCGAKLSLAGEPEESQVQSVLSEEERKKRAYEEELLRAKAQQAARVGTKSPGAAAVLSFLFTGLGQIYNGQIGKAILFIILGGISIILMFVGIGFILYPIILIIGIVDAYNTAKKANDALLRP